jgi:hypothetical protein
MKVPLWLQPGWWGLCGRGAGDRRGDVTVLGFLAAFLLTKMEAGG